MMGSKGGGGGGAGNNGVPAVIPKGARKIVQIMKEIVICSELETYAALEECNMCPNEASVDLYTLFTRSRANERRRKRYDYLIRHDVKDTTDPRPRGLVAPSRGGCTVLDHYASRGWANAPSSTAFISDFSKATTKRENGSHPFLSSSSTSAISVPNINRQLAHNIVKMGKPQVKSSVTPNHSIHRSLTPGLHGDFELHDQSAKLYKPEPPSISELVPSNDDDWPLDEQQAPPPNNDGWPPFENPQGTATSVLGAYTEDDPYSNPSILLSDGIGRHMTSQLDGGHLSEDGHIESNTNNMGFTSLSSRNIQEYDDRDPSLYDDNVYKTMNVFQLNMHSDEPNEDDYAEDDGVAAVSTNLQDLVYKRVNKVLQKSEQGSAPEEDGPAVVIPDHLQVHPSDCQQLSFGSFAPSIGAFPCPMGSGSLINSLAEAQPIPDTSSASHPEIGDLKCYGDEHLRPTLNGDDVHSGVPNSLTYEAPSASQPEVLTQHPGESVVGNPCAFPSAASGYSYEKSQALDSTFPHPQTSSPMQNLSPFSNVLPSYTDPLPSALVASTVQTGRETDLSYLPFPVAQPTATKYNNTASSLNSSNMSTQEGFGAGSNSASQQAPQNLPTASLATGPGLPQHLAMPTFWLPTLSLGHFASMANLVSYPFLPQRYSYMLSAFQQVFASNNSYHQSLAAVLPQYKSSVSTSNLTQSGAVAPGYGFNSSSNVPSGNFALNPSIASTIIGYEYALNSQYKDAGNLLSLRQNDNSGMGLPGAAARRVPNLPTGTYYNFLGQSQPEGLWQFHQPSQHVSGLGYPNFYQSGISPEQQLVRDGTLGGSQGHQQPKRSTQLW